MVAAIRRHFGAILTGIALAALALGTSGLLACDPASGLATALYRSVQLFYWNYFPWNTTLEAKLPWTLEIARWLAPVATLGALSRVAMALFQRRWNAWRAGRLSGHVVICGAGEKGTVLAAELRATGMPLVIIERDSARAEELTDAGALVIHGDATKPETLRHAAAPDAARVIIATGDDHDNLAIAMTAAQLGVGAIHAHSSNASLCDLYQRHRALASTLTGATTTRVFNHFRNIARCTLQGFPPEVGTAPVHVVLPGLDRLGTALAVEYALLGHFTNDRRIHLHIVSPTATRELAILQGRHAGLAQCAHVQAVDLASAEMFSASVAAIVHAHAGVFTIFPGLTDEEEAFTHVLELLELTRGRSEVRLLLPGAAESATRRLVETNAELRERIAFLPSPTSTCGYEAVVGESLDRTARAIHENWLAETRRQIEAARAAGDEALARRHEAKATFKVWGELSEEQKGASRSQADHIPFKLRAVGLNPATATAADWARLSAAEIETLARMEHARWAAYYWMTGWTLAPERDDARKQHPNLVGYNELDEATKDYDRAAVRNVGIYLGC